MVEGEVRLPMAACLEVRPVRLCEEPGPAWRVPTGSTGQGPLEDGQGLVGSANREQGINAVVGQFPLWVDPGIGEPLGPQVLSGRERPDQVLGA